MYRSFLLCQSPSLVILSSSRMYPSFELFMKSSQPCHDFSWDNPPVGLIPESIQASDEYFREHAELKILLG